MSRIIIGVAAKKRAGKDTLCEMLGKYQPFTQVAFADALWKTLLAADPWIDCDGFLPKYRRLTELNEKYGYEKCKTEFPEVRRLMQQLGTDGVREHVGQNTWLNIVEDQIKANPTTNFLVSDLRFDNEAAMVHRLGGWVVKLERGTSSSDEHISESIAGIHHDVLYVNNSSLNDLDEFAGELIRRIKR